MQKVGTFEKVSFEQYAAAVNELFDEQCLPPLDDLMLSAGYDSVQLPTRATVGSAGYDFKAPFNITMRPGDTIKVPTGIRVKIDEGWWLACVPRSSLGFKYRLQLDNTLGVIDSDYYNANNEGHVFVKMTNNGRKTVSIKCGDNFMQAIFIPYGITYDDIAFEERTGGIGSTDK